ncbi:hypothetical protein PISL3812_07872 [Talaromyces islandicus]|uniref:Mediator of RNA polymerase II transcription subunit 4 n=1 Tax=Talaromyces islandicus TaxID=28573 RepID=A0A0U1M7E1_TALIS|nr:hypothetical protein PISL3812_07872 [Talaromyces islandicus]
MNAQLSSALDGLENKLNALLSSLTTPTAAGAPTAAISLLEADDVVTSALDTLRTHQANYTKILRLRDEAESLEERIKGIVRDISGAGQEIVEATGGNDDGDYTDDESDTDSDSANVTEKPRKRSRKEVDYRLLLDFARRISKYNKEAAADAASGIGTGQKKKLQGKQTDANGIDTTAETDAQEAPVENVTKEATNWLDQTADADRQVFMIPYPNEDRIRMGLMGQLQMAAIDKNLDLDKEAERMVLEAEGAGVATAIPEAGAGGPDNTLAGEAAKAAAQAGSQVAERGAHSAARAPAPQPKAMLDLDLYDPDEDD